MAVVLHAPRHRTPPCKAEALPRSLLPLLHEGVVDGGLPPCAAVCCWPVVVVVEFLVGESQVAAVGEGCPAWVLLVLLACQQPLQHCQQQHQRHQRLPRWH